MRSRLTLVTACALALALPSTASAAFTVGISENQPSMFSDPIFQGVGFKQARVIVAWNVALDPANFEYARVRDYLAAAQAAGVEPLSPSSTRVATTRAAARSATSTRASASCRARRLTSRPSRRSSSRSRRRRSSRPGTRPTTSRSRRRAVPRRPRSSPTRSRSCARRARSSWPTSSTRRTTEGQEPDVQGDRQVGRDVPQVAEGQAQICGIHNYSDVNRFRSTGTAAIMKALGCKEYWLTETGGLYDFGSFWSKKTYKGCRSSSTCQVKATKYMFSLTKKNKKIKRLYVYTWFGNVTPRFDAGLVADGTERAALAEIRKYVKP